MADLKSFAEQLVNLTVKEVQELAQILKDAFPSAEKTDSSIRKVLYGETAFEGPTA